MDKASINQQLELYLRYKRYKQPICDVFPIIAVNALKTELCIINETGNNSCDLITLHPRSPSELPTVYLHRINDNHYNGLQSVSAQNRHQTTPSAVPLAIPHVDNHAVLHSASQVNCRTNSPVAHTPWQIASEGGQSRAMPAPACIRYSAAELDLCVTVINSTKESENPCLNTIYGSQDQGQVIFPLLNSLPWRQQQI